MSRQLLVHHGLPSKNQKTYPSEPRGGQGEPLAGRIPAQEACIERVRRTAPIGRSRGDRESVARGSPWQRRIGGITIIGRGFVPGLQPAIDDQSIHVRRGDGLPWRLI